MEVSGTRNASTGIEKFRHCLHRLFKSLAQNNFLDSEQRETERGNHRGLRVPHGRTRTPIGNNSGCGEFPLSRLVRSAHPTHMNWQGSCILGWRGWNEMTKYLSWFAVGVMLMMICNSAVFAQIVRKASDRPEGFGESEYQLGPEDVIQVFVWKENDLTTKVVIRPDGKVSLPLVGEVVASRKTTNQLQLEVSEKLKAFLENPVVNVIVTEVNSPKVSVFGEVRKPDVYKIKQRTTVLDAVALAGGLTEFAKKNKVVVIRDSGKGPQKFTLNLDSMLKGAKESIFYLQPGDTIYVQ